MTPAFILWIAYAILVVLVLWIAIAQAGAIALLRQKNRNLWREIERRGEETYRRFIQLDIVSEYGTGIALFTKDSESLPLQDANQGVRTLYFRKGGKPKDATYAARNPKTGEIEFFKTTTKNTQIK